MRICTIPGHTLVLPLVGVIVAVSFMHFPNKQSIRATLHQSSLSTTELLAAPNFDNLLSSVQSAVQQCSQYASLRPASSWIFEGANAVVSGVRSGSNSTTGSTMVSHPRVANSDVIRGMLNASNTWDVFWQRSFLGMSYAQGTFSLTHLRPDGLCTGIVGGHLAFRGNCSSCSIVMAVMNDTTQAAIRRSRVRISGVNIATSLQWTVNFSDIVGAMGCVSVGGAVECPNNKYFGNAPSSFLRMLPRLFAINDTLSSSSRDCFGLMRTFMTHPVCRMRYPNSSNASTFLTTNAGYSSTLAPDAAHLGVISMGINIDYVLHDTPTSKEELPTALVQGGGSRIIPLNHYPASVGNVTAATPYALCLTDQFDTPCVSTQQTLAVLWPDMGIAVAAAVALFSQSTTTGTLRLTTWVMSGDADDDMFVLGMRSGTASSIFVQYTFRRDMDASVRRNLNNLDRAMYIALGCLMAVIIVALSVVVLAMHVGAKAFEESLQCALEDALRDRLHRDRDQDPQPEALRKSSGVAPSVSGSSLIEMLPVPAATSRTPLHKPTHPSALHRSEKDSSISQPELVGAHAQQARSSIIQWAGGTSLFHLAAAVGSGLEVPPREESIISMSDKPDTSGTQRKISFPITGAAGSHRTGRNPKRSRSVVSSAGFTSQFSNSAGHLAISHSALEPPAAIPVSKATPPPPQQQRPPKKSMRHVLSKRIVSWALNFKEPRMLLDASTRRLSAARNGIAFIPLSSVVSLLASERLRSEERDQHHRESGCLNRLRRCIRGCTDASDPLSTSRLPLHVDDGLLTSKRTTLATPLRSFHHSSNDDAVPPLHFASFRATQTPTRPEDRAGTSSDVTDGSDLAPGLGSRAHFINVREAVVSPAPSRSAHHNFQEEPRYPTAAFVLFDIGFSLIDDAATTREYLKVMDMVLSHFGRFGGCVERTEASTVVASFGLHVLCDNPCDSAVRCAASLLKAMEEKLQIWSLDEDQIGLHMFATDYVICVDFGEAARHSFVYHYPTPAGAPGASLADLHGGLASVGKPIRQVVIHAPPLERLLGLIPLLRYQRFACTVTSSAAGQLSIPCIVADVVALPKADVDNVITWEHVGAWERVMLMELEGGDDIDARRLQVESQAVENAICAMAQCQYEQAASILQHAQDALGEECETLTRLRLSIDAQLSLPMDQRQPYRNTLNWLRRWALAAGDDAASSAPLVVSSQRLPPQASSAPDEAFVVERSPNHVPSGRVTMNDDEDDAEEQVPSTAVLPS